MTIRVRYKAEVAVSTDSNEAKDLGNPKIEVVCDSQGEGFTGKTVVATGAVDMQVNLGNVAAVRLLLLRTLAHDPTEDPGELRFRRNGLAGEEISVIPLVGTKEGILLLTGPLSALYVSNPGTVVMDVVAAAAGD